MSGAPAGCAAGASAKPNWGQQKDQPDGQARYHYLHPTSTVPMGGDSDPTAVVDAWGKVRGVDSLHVVDASIIPDIPSVATNVTTIMLAERIAAKLAK